MAHHEVGRRAFVAGAGALALGTAACSTYGTPRAGTTASTGASGGDGSVAPLAKTADIPVGGGTVFPDQQVVVTEPAAGEFKAFSAVCTHEGCLVDAVSGGTINCPCHGSRYKITDGSVVHGPATKPLAAKSVVVQGDSLVVT